MSTFMPEIHGKPESLLVEIWKGEGVRVTYNGEVVCQGRSINDLRSAVDQYFKTTGLYLALEARDVRS